MSFHTRDMAFVNNTTTDLPASIETIHPLTDASPLEFYMQYLCCFNLWNFSMQINMSNSSKVDSSTSCPEDLLMNLMCKLLFVSRDSILPDPLPQSVTIAFITLYILIIFLGIVGNVVVIVVIGLAKTVKSVTDLYIMSLAVSDLLIAVLNMPFQLYFIVANEWLTGGEVGEFLCKFTNYIQGVTVVSSILTLAAIAIDRYIVICQPSLSRRMHQKQSAVLTLLTVWLLALLSLCPHLIYQGLDRRIKLGYVDGVHTFNGIGYICAVFYPHQKIDGRIFSLCVYIFLYVLPVITMVFTYGAIAHRLWIRKPINTNVEEPKYVVRNLAQKKRVIKMLMLLVLVFTLLWLPFFTFSIYNDFVQEDSTSKLKMAIFQIVGYSNICVNPIIYTFLNKTFQREFYRRCCFIRRNRIQMASDTRSRS